MSKQELAVIDGGAPVEIEISATGNKWNAAAVRMVVENDKIPSERAERHEGFVTYRSETSSTLTRSMFEWNRLALERHRLKPSR